MPKKPSHIHRLKMHKYKNGTTIYFCTLPECYHKVESHLTVGKVTLCNICHQPFIMTERTALLLRPHCSNCGRQRIQDDDGRHRYIRKFNNKAADNASAVEQAQELRSRLDNLVRNEAEEDI